MSIGEATARARTNIALVKYWGKRDVSLNLPAVGSVSMTLSALHTTTTVRFDSLLRADAVLLDRGPAKPEEARRVSALLDRVRSMARLSAGAEVTSENNFPTTAGLASSASGFAALAAAASEAAGLSLSLAALAQLARQASGSAPRSLLGGFVELPAGTEADGRDCLPAQILPPEAWDIRMLVVLVTQEAKEVGSTAGMELTRETSPYYEAWVRTHPPDMDEAIAAIRQRDLPRLGEVAEHSCFKMHGCMSGSLPALIYWRGTTIDVLRRVFELRRAGLPGWATVDAGPHVKVLCAPEVAAELGRALALVPGVERILTERPGQGVERLADAGAGTP
jgi:diphosphomevalonate decarboxylase